MRHLGRIVQRESPFELNLFNLLFTWFLTALFAAVALLIYSASGWIVRTPSAISIVRSHTTIGSFDLSLLCFPFNWRGFRETRKDRVSIAPAHPKALGYSVSVEILRNFMP